MKFNLRKNKLMLINTILLLISFIVFFIFLNTINYKTSCDGDYSLWATFMDEIKYGHSYGLKEEIYFIYIPLILVIINGGIIFMILAMFICNKFNYYILMLVQSIYLVTIVYVYLVDLSFKHGYIIPYLSSLMLLPIIVFSVYNLACIISFYLKDKKKPVDIEKAVDTEKENII